MRSCDRICGLDYWLEVPYSETAKGGGGVLYSRALGGSSGVAAGKVLVRVRLSGGPG